MWRTNLTISILAESAFIIADEMIAEGFASSRDDFERCWLAAPQFFANRQQSRGRLINQTYVHRLKWRLKFVMDHVPETTRDRVQRILELIDQAEGVATALAR
jgi:predicted PP-loop superfamily ATPase